MKVVLDALRQRFLELNFTISDQSIEILERPGLWMSSDRLQLLSASLREVAGKTLHSGALKYGVFSGEAERLSASTITLVRDRVSKRPVAFNALAHMETRPGHRPVDVIHLGLVMVDPDVQSKGFSWILYGLTCVFLFLRAGLRPCYISNVTQVPAVIGMVSEIFSEVAPTPDSDTPKDFQKVLIARAIMADHRHVFGVGEDAEFDDQKFIIRNAYTGGSDDLKKPFAATAKHRQQRYNHWCAESLDYDRGDDFLQIGLIDLSAARRYVLRTVPKKSLVRFLLLGVIGVTKQILVPVIQWFDTKHDFGRLRAR